MTHEDAHWDSRFGMPGINGEVRALALDGDWLYAGGQFTFAGTAYANSVVRWNRRTQIWQTLGAGPFNGVDGIVVALAVRGDSVIVGGQFTHAGDIEAENIAVWNTHTQRWGSFGNSTGDRYAYISAIAVDSDNIYVGGRFTSIGGLIANNVARWDGMQWQRVGGGVNKYVYALALDGSKLYAGGVFTAAGTVLANHIAVWDGVEWKAMGAGFSGDVYAVCKHRGSIYAGGEFDHSGNDQALLVARWDEATSRWEGLKDSLQLTNSERVYALASWGDTLVAAGAFTLGYKPNNVFGFTRNMAFWTGTGWTWPAKTDKWFTKNIGMRDAQPSGYAMVVTDSVLYIGGEFSSVADSPLNVEVSQPTINIAAWHKVERWWSVLGQCLDDDVRTIIAGEDRMYVGGKFSSTSGEVMHRVAQWNGQDWLAMDNGILGADTGRYSRYGGDPDLNYDVYAMAMSGRTVYAGGSFNFFRYGQSMMFANFVRWDGAKWFVVDDSVITPTITERRVQAMINRGDTLVIGVPSYVGILDQRLDTTVPYNLSKNITSLTIGEPYLYAGGDNSSDGKNAISRLNINTGVWDYTDDDTCNGSVYALAADGDYLYAGGTFSRIGGISALRLAMYNTKTHTWSNIGNVRLDDSNAVAQIHAIAVSDDRVYIGGWFTSVGGVPARNVAMFDGEEWHSLGSGVDSTVLAIAVQGDDVYLGGSFHTIGGVIPSWHFAHWNATMLGVDHGPQLPDGSQSHGVVETLHATSLRAQLQVHARPNPSTGMTQLQYTLPRSGHVRLSLFDMLGREVAVLVDGAMSAGEHSTEFDVGGLTAGSYYCRVQLGQSVGAARLMVSW